MFVHKIISSSLAIWAAVHPREGQICAFGGCHLGMQHCDPWRPLSYYFVFHALWHIISWAAGRSNEIIYDNVAKYGRFLIPLPIPDAATHGKIHWAVGNACVCWWFCSCQHLGRIGVIAGASKIGVVELNLARPWHDARYGFTFLIALPVSAAATLGETPLGHCEDLGSLLVWTHVGILVVMHGDGRGVNFDVVERIGLTMVLGIVFWLWEYSTRY